MPVETPVRNPAELFTAMMRGAASDANGAFRRRPVAHIRSAPEVRTISMADIRQALKGAVSDFAAARDDVLFVAVIYPIAGLVLAQFAFRYDLLPLIFPLVSGFALVGPLAAVGMYEISRRRERGEQVSWTAAFEVFRSPALNSIMGLGAILLGLFLLWMGAAYLIWWYTLGPTPPHSAGAFVRETLGTSAGWSMIVIGFAVGFVFAVAAFALSVVSLPLMIDRHVDLDVAIGTSVRAVRSNVGPMAAWGLIVAAALVLGSIPALVGLIFVLPVLGHATWRLYRRLVTPV
jgi:uncharacterized membrane protein